MATAAGTADEETHDECAICSTPIAELKHDYRRLAQPVGCPHVSCLECLMRWVQESNTCPICRFRMTSFNLLRDGQVESTIHVEERGVRQEEEQDGPTEGGVRQEEEQDGRTELMIEAFAGNAARVTALLATPGLDVNEYRNGRTALMLAAVGWAGTVGWSGLGDCGRTVAALLAAPGIDINATDEHGRTALVLAAETVSSRFGRSTPYAQRRIGVSWATAELMVEAFAGNAERVTELLATPGLDVNEYRSAGVLRNTPAQYYGRTALMQAAVGRSGYRAVMALLAAPGIDLNARDRDGRTALMLAVEAGNTETIRVLMKAMFG